LVVLAIDPGNDKCGIAVVDSDRGVLEKEIAKTGLAAQRAHILFKNHKPDCVILGNGTNSHTLMRDLDLYSEIKVELVDEKYSTMLARTRYFKDNPPKGLRKLIPIGMQTPKGNIDDYAAVILAEAFIRDLTDKNWFC
jgi:RNase H-fold protein (predicted Holliday junction resolvase)